MQKFTSAPVGPHFWGAAYEAGRVRPFPRYTGNVEIGELVGDGSVDACHKLVDDALTAISRIFTSIDKPDPKSRIGLVDLKMCPKLAKWKEERQKQGRVLPSKGKGLARTTDKVIELLDCAEWPAPLLTTNALFGVGMAAFLIGAYDPQVLYSNYCVDMAFYYEHGYDRVFPEFEPMFQAASDDPHARNSFAGYERREAAKAGLRYIRGKVELERQYLPHLTPGRSAKFDRTTAATIMWGESSLVGLAAEAITRGHDVSAVAADMIFSSPATDVVDVGSDLGNCETMNSFLNTADITNTGIVSEEALRRIYDAYSFTCARMFAERWATPTSPMNGQIYIWHMRDDRHLFLRRCLLGYEKVRRDKPNLREADMDEVFDEDYHTTGFSRPLKNACDGHETCNQVTEVIQGHERRELLGRLWYFLVVGPMEYVRSGVVSLEKEEELGNGLHECQAECWHESLVHEMAYLVCHASFHAWQVNFLMEAAMWGSFLDDGALNGKLDRAE